MGVAIIIFKELKAAVAPGRVNLIGDHVDYCDGFVLPMVGHTTLHSCSGTAAAWGRYVQGILALTHCDLCFDLVIHSTIPMGGGLSSSAALELASYYLISQFLPNPLPCGVVSAQLCCRAEHEFADVPCGIMDQFVIALAEHGHAIRIDCRQLTYELIPMSIAHDTMFLITNSGIHHTNADGEYAMRRKMVDEALKVFGVSSWRDVTHEIIREKSPLLNATTIDCAHHVVDEIDRTVKASEALLDNDITHFGRFMCESHYSLKDKYRVSCPEIDELVSMALSCEGVFGSRMTGGGFGGCTVTLVRKENVDDVKNYIKVST
ncbi:galactokinase [Teladorsagia circumcincta]|uniref:Galactokinase n=1 Tax=Teladorsagia circumcincta TaxID=45464 RepID=A0A2G9UD03_TELCI|nr:galactokinase [Teladorsagia circumcincta]